MKITIGKYFWNGHLGNWWSSIEKHVTEGDVRVIEGELFYAYQINSRFRTGDIISWKHVSKNEVKDIEVYKRKFLNL